MLWHLDDFSFTEKYTKDLCATKKKLADVEAKLQASEKQARTPPPTSVSLIIVHVAAGEAAGAREGRRCDHIGSDEVCRVSQGRVATDYQ